MEPVTLPDDVRAVVDGRNFAHVATVLPSGAPHSVPVWILREGDRLCFFTQPGSRKARNLAADPRVAISLIDLGHPYRTAQLRGRVVETREGEEALRTIDRISEKYTGGPFPMRSGVVFVVEPERVHYLELPFVY
ncbi:MAG: PPOX class F420-dependent oxidoreductase [Pseudomonadota bacterium]